MYADDTPILESVFEDLAPDAVSISDIIEDGLPLGDMYWYFVPLCYRELLEWTQERRSA
jgi:hypothetical protein